MPFPIVPIVSGIAAGAAGSLLSKKAKAPDYSGVLRELDASGRRQREIATSVRPQTTAVNQQFGANASSLTAALQNKSQALGRDYIRDAGSSATNLGNNLADTLKQRVLRQTPELQRQLREGMAASGGLNRGALGAGLSRVAVGQAQELGSGLRDITAQELAAKQKAIDSVFNTDQDTLRTATGLDYQTLQALLNAGRTDIIQEAASLLDSERSINSAKAGILGAGADAASASSAASAANQNDLIAALLQGIGKGAGYAFENRNTPKAS
ncbi:MAG: hypothetical protein E6Q97_06675 [Desulfurellales bacterium]|nr:MAG: hypothetical protein E6Q97_06675 [Desulfurellales bacterium]